MKKSVLLCLIVLVSLLFTTTTFAAQLVIPPPPTSPIPTGSTGTNSQPAISQPSSTPIPSETQGLASCTQNWQCTDFSTCSNAGTQTRTCTDINNCGTTTNKPVETQTCIAGCVNQCSTGQTSCITNAKKMCITNTTGCLIWGNTTNCPTGQVCNPAGTDCTTTSSDSNSQSTASASPSSSTSSSSSSRYYGGRESFQIPPPPQNPMGASSSSSTKSTTSPAKIFLSSSQTQKTLLETTNVSTTLPTASQEQVKEIVEQAKRTGWAEILGVLVIIIVLAVAVYYVTKFVKEEIEQKKNLNNYVKNSLGKGYPASVITKELAKTGWNQKEIDKAFKTSKENKERNK